MINEDLANLNFCQLLHYGGQPKVQNVYNPQLDCSGYCVSCEESGKVFKNANDYFDQLSHGCDTSDFEELLGNLDDAKNEFPVMFLLENPGADYSNGDIVPYRGYKKQPPVNHYYWTPNIDKWPDNADTLPNLYGPYFAYLMKKFEIGNVYITNVIKCNTITSNHREYKKGEAIEICVNMWLKNEIKMFSPRYIFCFGGNPYNYLKKYLPDDFNSRRCVKLIHPSALGEYRKPGRIVSENNRRISSCNIANT